MGKVTTTGGALVLCLLLSGCAEPPVAPLASPAPPPSVPGPFTMDDEMPATSGIIWDDATRAAATATANAVVSAFTQQGLDQNSWWAALLPYLTVAAANAYATVDVANIPATTIAGPASIVDTSTEFLVTLEVPTTGGTYIVLLQKFQNTDPWLVERLTLKRAS